MSAERLREAAEGMRGEYETDPYRLGQTMRAVADVMDALAQRVEDICDATPTAAFGERVAQQSLTGYPEALAVAGAYLGAAP